MLTAFLVVSLLLLQPDNSQTTVQLLSLIALQGGVPMDLQPMLNETASSLPRSATVRAPGNAATINTLWFASLVLSLAAALFGILAKQWCREYLRWHNVISSARENVLVRQVRFEAWEQWRAASLIASIPAFLEVALALFLVGLLMFVPTFSEHRMTVVVSVVIYGVLIGVTILTVLPLFYRLCPFQTPTGWAFILIIESLPWLFGLLFLCAMYPVMVCTFLLGKGWFCSPIKYLRDMCFKLRPSLQRRRDWRSYVLYTVTDLELCSTVFPDVHKEAAASAVQSHVLARALTWVRRGSNAEAVVAAILESLLSITPPPHTRTRYTPDALTDPRILSSVYSIHSTDPFRVFQMARACFVSTADGTVSFLTGPQSPFHRTAPFGPFLPAEVGTDEFWDEYQAVFAEWDTNPAFLEVWHALLQINLLSLVEDWLAAKSDTILRKSVAEKIAMIFSIWRLIPTDDIRRSSGSNVAECMEPWAKTLETIYQKLMPHEAATADGLVPMCIELCRLLGPVVFECNQGERRIIGMSPRVMGFLF